MEKIASLDVGSFTVRLLVAALDRQTGRIEPLAYGRRITRLGGGLLKGGAVKEQAVEDTARAVADFAHQARREGAGEILAVGTGALRRAAAGPGGDDLVRRLSQAGGVGIRVISGQEEARLSLWGAASAWGDILEARPGGPLVFFDLGGQSLELVVVAGPGNGSGLDQARYFSFEKGAAGMTERFLPVDPPSANDIKRLRAAVLAELGPAIDVKSLTAGPGLNLIGTAGTVSTLVALDLEMTDYDRSRVNGHKMSRDRVAYWLARLSGLGLSRRAGLPGLEPGRAGVIVGGVAVVLSVMEYFEVDGLWVVDAGLLEGVVVDWAASQKGKGA